MKRKKLILIPLLIISLIVFNFPIYSVLAEGETNNESGEQTEVQNNNSGTEETTESQEAKENTSIETGNAEAEIGVVNEANTNIADLGEQNENNNTDDLNTETSDTFIVTTTPQILATSSPESLTTTTDEIIGENSQTESLTFENVVIQNNNKATTTTEVSGEAITGLNSSNLNGDDASIKTGDAITTANAVNVVNTNITGSNFWFLLSNFFYNLTGNLYVGDFSTNQNNNCGIIDCVNSLDVENNNDGTIINDVEVFALTGFNSASGNAGNVSLETGNAQVTANVINLLNTNITGSNWFFGIFNNFGDWSGNFVFPGNGAVENFISGSDSNNNTEASAGSNDTNIENNSQAEIENNVNVTADTGDNSANGNWGGSSIETGKAQAAANILNTVNTNIFGNNWLMIAIKVFGDWSGNIFSLPPGISWIRTADGVILYSSDLIDNFLNGNNNDSNQGENSGSLNMKSNNIAKIVNNLNLFARTGGNSASYNAGDGSIETGDASATANISNFVNTNIVGRNWLMASINVFGDWQGNLAFGQPDLWIGESATTSEKKINRASYLTYTLSYTNNGDAPATNVILSDNYNNRYLGMADAGGGDASVPGEIKWDIGSVPINGSGSVSYTLFIRDTMPYGGTYLKNSSLIDSYEDDRNNGDNNESLTLLMSLDPPMGWMGGPPKLPHIEVNKTNDAKGFVYPGDIVNYKIKAANKGVGSAYDVVLTDTLKNESSEVIKTQSWELGEIMSNEEITIEYGLLINGGIEPGIYTNAVEIQGKDVNDRNISILSGQIDSVIKVKEKEGNEESKDENIQEEQEGQGQTGTLAEAEETETQPAFSEEKTESIDEQIKEFIGNINPFSPGPEAEAAESNIEETDSDEKTFTEESENEEINNKEETRNLGQYLLASMANLWQNKLLIYLLILIALGFLALAYLKSKRKKSSF